MSNSSKWIIAIILILLIALGIWWWMNSSSTSAPAANQPAAAVTSVTATTSPAGTMAAANAAADAKIAKDSQTVNAQIQAASTVVAALNSKSTAAQVSSAATTMNQLISSLSQLKTEVQARLATASGVSTGTLGGNLQGASQQYLLASSAIAKAVSLLKTPTTANVQQAVLQFSSALTFVKSAFSSVTSVATAIAGH